MGTLITILIPIGVGTYWIYKNLSAVIKTFRSRGWPTVEGVVIESYVGSGQGELNSQEFEPVLRCKFVVDQSAYVCRKINWNPHKSRSKQTIQAWINRYPQGSNATVYYDPANPWDSVLEPVAPQALGRIIAGIGFVVIGLFMTISCTSGSWCPDMPLEEVIEVLGD
ncbi:MAG: DUF3592 domain-containing protein [Candidatus Hermodarchaeia archaeon]|jgi:hypothetical protein